MLLCRPARACAFLLLAAGAAAVAQDPPPGGEAVPAGFRSYVVADERFPKDNVRNRTDRMHDFVVEYGLNPVVAVFSRTGPKADAPAANLAQQLDPVAANTKVARLGTFVAFLTIDAKKKEGGYTEYPEDENRDKKAEEVRALAAQLKTPNVPYGLAGSQSEALEKWGVKEGDDLTVVLYDKMKVVQRWTFTADKPASDDDLKAIVARVEQYLKQGK